MPPIFPRRRDAYPRGIPFEEAKRNLLDALEGCLVVANRRSLVIARKRCVKARRGPFRGPLRRPLKPGR
jgi:hypothetical protein